VVREIAGHLITEAIKIDMVEDNNVGQLCNHSYLARSQVRVEIQVQVKDRLRLCPYFVSVRINPRPVARRLHRFRRW
jgi:hypothetical protein